VRALPNSTEIRSPLRLVVDNEKPLPDDLKTRRGDRPDASGAHFLDDGVIF
jgi:hypothetical protein